MLVAYSVEGSALKAIPVASGLPIPRESVWIDMFAPKAGDDIAVERLTGVAVPTREEMREIEPSSRLYTENGARYMTAALLCGSDSAAPTVQAVTFILASPRLVTVRYGEPRAFATTAAHLTRAAPPGASGETILIELLEAIVDRAADVLEQIAADVEVTSTQIFAPAPNAADANQRYRALLSQIGRKEGLISAARESLASLQRLLSFFGAELDGHAVSPDARASIKSMSRDVGGLSDYAAFLSGKLQFLLDATIGMVGLEQNNIIKIFAVLTVVLMPPTLIASVYGMNFQNIPELSWTYGYPTTLAAMVISAIVPYVFFKWRGWL
ncbi:magnesium transporter CorA family protein [Xanthobacter sp. V4C-4]|uniref:magnesium transporter CorA family protein n=1 Tax=Xanthobacter cornucopiae TaxID=3119924 RepID=UPI00372B0A61